MHGAWKRRVKGWECEVWGPVSGVICLEHEVQVGKREGGGPRVVKDPVYSSEHHGCHDE